jgi:hypothetical protein
MTVIKMSDTEHKLCSDAMKGDKGAVLIDVLTDQMLLKDGAGDALEKQGMGKVIKFLRDLHNGSNNFLTTPKK